MFNIYKQKYFSIKYICNFDHVHWLLHKVKSKVKSELLDSMKNSGYEE
jgi:hypothetical protein